MGNKTSKTLKSVINGNFCEITMRCAVPMLEETNLTFTFDKELEMMVIRARTNNEDVKSVNIVYDYKKSMYGAYWVKSNGTVVDEELELFPNLYYLMHSWIPFYDMIMCFTTASNAVIEDHELKYAQHKHETKSSMFKDFSLFYTYLSKDDKFVEFVIRKEIEPGVTAFLVSLIKEEKTLSKNEVSEVLPRDVTMREYQVDFMLQRKKGEKD